MTNKLNDELMNLVSGGKLPKGWERIADSLAPGLQKQYPGITYKEACDMLGDYFTDQEDIDMVAEYIKKYFPEEQTK